MGSLAWHSGRPPREPSWNRAGIPPGRLSPTSERLSAALRSGSHDLHGAVSPLRAVSGHELIPHTSQGTARGAEAGPCGNRGLDTDLARGDRGQTSAVSVMTEPYFLTTTKGLAQPLLTLQTPDHVWRPVQAPTLPRRQVSGTFSHTNHLLRQQTARDAGWVPRESAVCHVH